MSMDEEAQLCEQLTRYVAGDCSTEEVQELSSRLERDAAACDLLGEILMQGAAVREFAQAHPQPVASVNRAPQRWQAWLWPLAAAAAVVLTAVIWMQNGRDEERVLRVAEVSGSVRWTGQGGSIVDGLSKEAALGGGTVETVSDDAAVTLAFRDGSLITLMAHSAATISDDGQKQVHLRAGNLSADVRPQRSGRPMLIHTAAAVLEVVGTRFDVESGAATTRLNVDEGTVRMTRLVDGSTVDVPAEHEAVASLSRAEKLAAVQRRPPALSWRSDLSQGAQGTEGEWLPAVGEVPARLRALPKLVNPAKRGPVTLHSASFAVPWEYLQTLQLKPDSRLRVRGRMTTLAPVEIMLSTKRAGGGFAGNYFIRPEPDTNQWQLDLPITAFRKWSTDGTEPLPDGLQLRRIVLYTIGTDAGLEIEQVEVVNATAR
jgi:ferric-dicitrate binding protein FerR (iron transport regulator)